MAAATPDYQMGCNRLLLSRAWYPTLARPNVDLIGAGVIALTDHGIACSDGSHVETDVIVWCTGFTATEYLAPGVAGSHIEYGKRTERFDPALYEHRRAA